MNLGTLVNTLTAKTGLKAVASAAILVSILGSSLSYGEYVAYAVTKKNKEIPLPENVDPIGAKDMLNVKWSPFSGK